MPLQELCNRIQYIIIHHLRYSIQLQPYHKVISSNDHFKKHYFVLKKKNAGFRKKCLIVRVLRLWYLGDAQVPVFVAAVPHEHKDFSENLQRVIFTVSFSSSSRSKRFKGAQELTKARRLFIIFSMPEQVSAGL